MQRGILKLGGTVWTVFCSAQTIFTIDAFLPSAMRFHSKVSVIANGYGAWIEQCFLFVGIEVNRQLAAVVTLALSVLLVSLIVLRVEQKHDNRIESHVAASLHPLHLAMSILTTPFELIQRVFLDGGGGWAPKYCWETYVVSASSERVRNYISLRKRAPVNIVWQRLRALSIIAFFKILTTSAVFFLVVIGGIIWAIVAIFVFAPLGVIALTISSTAFRYVFWLPIGAYVAYLAVGMIAAQ